VDGRTRRRLRRRWTEGGRLRPAAPGDFCVLLRAKKHLGAYVKALEKAGLPVWAPVNQILALLGIMMVASAMIRMTKRSFYERGAARRWLRAATAFCVIGIALFFLTQNTHNLIVLFDIWTPVHLVIFAVILTLVRFAYEGKRFRKDEAMSSPRGNSVWH